MRSYKLIVSFIHGNALGVVLEPSGARETFDPHQLRHLWQVRIGPLVPEVAVGEEFPKEDFERVVDDLKAFCEQHGITRGLEIAANEHVEG